MKKPVTCEDDSHEERRAHSCVLGNEGLELSVQILTSRTKQLPGLAERVVAGDLVVVESLDRFEERVELLVREAGAGGADAIVACHTEHLSAEVIERLPEEVKIVANFSVGFDHVDIEAAKRRGLVVTNTPDVLSDATAELTMMLMIGAARQLGGEIERTFGPRGVTVSIAFPAQPGTAAA